MMEDYGEYIGLLRQMVSIPSPSFEEKGVLELLCSFFDERNLPYRIERGNLIAICRGFDDSKKTLVLDAHIDTVPVSQGYTRDPFDPGKDAQTVWGLGANDDGGSVVSMIAAFRHFFDSQLSFNLVLALTVEEERSGENGACYLYSADGPLGAEGELKADWVIVGEPTGMKAATSERGLLVLDGLAEGVSGHAARGEGVNALYIALDDIAALRNYKFERISPRMGEVAMNVTMISCGTAHNVIPDKCTFTVDIRPTEQYSNEEILSMLQQECRSSLKARNLSNRSSATKEDSPLLKTIEALGIETFSSPTTSDWMRIDADCIKMGPGESSRSHRSDEFIKISEIETAIQTYIKFISTFDGNTLE